MIKPHWVSSQKNSTEFFCEHNKKGGCGLSDDIGRSESLQSSGDVYHHMTMILWPQVHERVRRPVANLIRYDHSQHHRSEAFNIANWHGMPYTEHSISWNLGALPWSLCFNIAQFGRSRTCITKMIATIALPEASNLHLIRMIWHVVRDPMSNATLLWMPQLCCKFSITQSRTNLNNIFSRIACNCNNIALNFCLSIALNSKDQAHNAISHEWHFLLNSKSWCKFYRSLWPLIFRKYLGRNNVLVLVHNLGRFGTLTNPWPSVWGSFLAILDLLSHMK